MGVHALCAVKAKCVVSPQGYWPARTLPCLDLIDNVTGIEGLSDVTGTASQFAAGRLSLSPHGSDRHSEGTVRRRGVAWVL